MAEGETYKIRLGHYEHRVRMITYVAAALLGEIACIAAGVFDTTNTFPQFLKALTFTQVIVASLSLVFARAQFEWEVTKLETYLHKNSLDGDHELAAEHQPLPPKPELLWRTSLCLIVFGGICILLGAWQPVVASATS